MTKTRAGDGRTVVAAAVAGGFGWLGVLAIGLQLFAASPATLGFDLELLLRAGRDIGAGRSPYAPELVAGNAPTATSLFYSYPPPVGQAMTLFAAFPSAVMLIVLGGLAVGGFLVAAEALRRRLAPERSKVAVAAVAIAAVPLTLPLAVGLLFGNFDVFFPFLYGTMLLAVLAPTRSTAVAGGVALMLAMLKIHPASMALWFLVRAVRDRTSGAARVLVVAMLAGLAIVVLSLSVGGPAIWTEYLQVVRAGTNAIIVDPRNAGLAALAVGAIGGGDQLARTLHLIVGAAAVVITIWAAWRREDPVESVAWATAASLSTLPVTWYHYPSALIPVALAAWLRAAGPTAGRVRATIVVAAVVAAAALVLLPLVWVAIGLVIAAARWSRPAARVP